MASAGAGTGGAASGSSPGSFRKKKGKKRDGEGGSGSGTGSGSGSGKRDYRCYLQLGLHHMRHSIEVFRPTHALELMTTCCSIRDDARTHYAMQIAQLLAGKLSEAVEGLAEGGAIDNPKLKVKAAVARALAQARTDRLPMAERGLSKAAGLDPLVWHVHAARGLVMALQNKAEEAIAAWTVGIGHCPKATLLHCLKGMEEARGGEAAKAELSFNKAKSANLNDPLPLYYIALLQDTQGSTSAAKTSYERFLERAPDDVAGLVSYGMLCIALDHFDKAVECLSRALEVEPTCLAARTTRAVAHCLAGSFAEATDDGMAALAALPRAGASGLSASSAGADPLVPIMRAEPASWLGIGGEGKKATRGARGCSWDPLKLAPAVKASMLRGQAQWLTLRAAVVAERWSDGKNVATDILTDEGGVNVDALVLRSRCYEKLLQNERAVADIAAALAIDPSDEAANAQYAALLDSMVMEP